MSILKRLPIVASVGVASILVGIPPSFQFIPGSRNSPSHLPQMLGNNGMQGTENTALSRNTKRLVQDAPNPLRTIRNKKRSKKIPVRH